MKVTMSIKELTELAGLAKEFDEVCCNNGDKRAPKQMVQELIERYKEVDDKGLYKIYLDKKMNIVIKVNSDAACDIMDIARNFIATMWPLYKAAFEAGTMLSKKVEGVVDKYSKKPEATEPEPSKVVVVSTCSRKESCGEKQVETNFGGIFDSFNDIMKDIDKHHKNNENRKEDTSSAEVVAGGEKKPVKKRLHMYKCPICGSTKTSCNTDSIVCKKCGIEMEDTEKKADEESLTSDKDKNKDS